MTTSRFFHNKAFVLGNYLSGEADRVLILLTEDFGKIQVTIKGIRKSKKREKIATEVLSYVDFTFYKKVDQFIVSNFSSIEIFMGIRSDLNRIGFGFYLMDIVNKFVFEGYRVTKIFQLLKNSLYYLERETDLKKQIILLLYFLYRMIQEEGILEKRELESKLSQEENEIFSLLDKNEVKELQENQKYRIEKIMATIRKLESYVTDKLDTEVDIDRYTMGGLLC